jgi:hypothetical protein
MKSMLIWFGVAFCVQLLSPFKNDVTYRISVTAHAIPLVCLLVIVLWGVKVAVNGEWYQTLVGIPLLVFAVAGLYGCLNDALIRFFDWRFYPRLVGY